MSFASSRRQSNQNLHHSQHQHLEISDITGGFVIKSKCGPNIPDFYQTCYHHSKPWLEPNYWKAVSLCKKRKERSDTDLSTGPQEPQSSRFQGTGAWGGGGGRTEETVLLER